MTTLEKIFRIAVLISMMCGLVACGNKKDNNFDNFMNYINSEY